VLGCLTSLYVATPAAAQVAIEAVIQTDYRVRGYSVSDGRPAAGVSLNYDHPSGVYLGAAAAGTIRGGEPKLVALQGNIGYAVRLTPTLSIDGGASTVKYFYGFGTTRNFDYDELYLGLALPNVAARLSYSPDYFNTETPTLYAEVDAGIEPAPHWFVSAHAGVLTYVETPPVYIARRRYDWRLGVSRQLGAYGLHLDLSGRLQDHAPYYRPGIGPRPDHTTIVLSLTRAI
jgi:uncharacterized protein (TIGR02001 family)